MAFKKTINKIAISFSIAVNFVIMLSISHSNTFLHALQRKIIIDSRSSKLHFFIFSCNLFNSWDDVFASWPLLFLLKRYANSHGQAFIVVGACEEKLGYLFRNNLVDGYIYSEEVFYNKKVFLKCYSLTICVKYCNIQEKRIFSNVFSYLNFFKNNYIIKQIEWINLVVANNFFIWLFRMTKSKNITINVQVYKWSDIVYKIIFCLNLQLWTLIGKRIFTYKMNIFEIIQKVGAKYSPDFKYQPTILNNYSYNKKKELPLTASAHEIDIQQEITGIDFSKKYIVIGVSCEKKYTLWPAEYLARVIIFLKNVHQIQALIIMENTPVSKSQQTYIALVNRALGEQNYLDQVQMYYLNNQNWDVVARITQKAEFFISFQNSFHEFFYHCGKSGIVISGHFISDKYYPIPKKMLLKHQIILATRCRKISKKWFKRWFSKKINLIQLKLLYPENIFTDLNRLAAKNFRLGYLTDYAKLAPQKKMIQVITSKTSNKINKK